MRQRSEQNGRKAFDSSTVVSSWQRGQVGFTGVRIADRENPGIPRRGAGFIDSAARGRLGSPFTFGGLMSVKPLAAKRLWIPAAFLAIALAATGCPKKPKPPATTPTPTPEASPTPTPDLDAQMKGEQNATPTEGDMTACGAQPIHFDYDSSVIKADGQDTLKQVAACLNEHATWTLLLAGHTDERGTTQYNLALGERRAHAAEKWLLDAGIAKNRLSTVSYGSEKPVAEGHDEAAWAQNRRVEFQVTQK